MRSNSQGSFFIEGTPERAGGPGRGTDNDYRNLNVQGCLAIYAWGLLPAFLELNLAAARPWRDRNVNWGCRNDWGRDK